MPDDSGASAVTTRAHTQLPHSAHEAAGPLGTRHSPRPLCRGRKVQAKSRARRAAEGKRMSAIQRECAAFSTVIAGHPSLRAPARQSSRAASQELDCFVARAPRNDGKDGSRLQPGLRSSPSDAKHRPKTARDVDRQPEMLRSPRLLTTRIERRGAIAMEFVTRSDVHPPWSRYPSASCYGIRREGSQRLDCFVASVFARRRASADKSAPRNDVESIG